MYVKVYTDGACSGNPGPGGYGGIICYEEETNKVYGYEENTTNNRMELKAVIESMKKILEMIFQENKKIDKLEIISDSAYVVNAINLNWLNVWNNNGFVNSSGEDIKNSDLWKQLNEYLDTCNFIKLEVLFTKVKGHNGNFFNEQVDKLAKQQIIKNKK